MYDRNINLNPQTKRQTNKLIIRKAYRIREVLQHISICTPKTSVKKTKPTEEVMKIELNNHPLQILDILNELIYNKGHIILKKTPKGQPRQQESSHLLMMCKKRASKQLYHKAGLYIKIHSFNRHYKETKSTLITMS